jgi:SPASM domain peptide maturase of grasp-with-spasm system
MVFNDEYVKLFSCCILVKGANRTVICDLQRFSFHFLPNVLYDILQESKAFKINQLKEKYCQTLEDENIFDEYISFLEKHEYIFKCSEGENEYFPEMNLEWDAPSKITNAIVEIGDYNIHQVLEELSQLNCKHVEFRDFKGGYNYDSILGGTLNSRISSISAHLLYQPHFEESFIKNICHNHFRISELILFNSPFNKKIDLEGLPTNVQYLTERLIGHSSCGKILPYYFSVNIQTFTESQKHNTCLNRKISIDAAGNIKNCPSMTKSYGNIRDTTLREAIEKQGFKDVWYIHKDQIEVCKDCEFRHICTDCRAYIQDPNNIYSKPAKCSYDPYTATWGTENPTQNPLHGQ